MKRDLAGAAATSLAAIATFMAAVAPSMAAKRGPEIRLTVFAAASLANAFTEIGRLFERRHPGVTVRFNFAGTQILAGQIEQGARGDVFASADERWMEHVRAGGLVAGDPQVFARNRLVVLYPRSNPARLARLEDLARPGVKIVIGAESVPVGSYTRTVIARLAGLPGFPADYARRVLANVVSQEENVRAVVGKVQLGEADAGFAYRSDVSRTESRSIGRFEIPEAANVTATYPIAPLAGTQAAELARSFVALVRAPEGQSILARHGFLSAETAAP